MADGSLKRAIRQVLTHDHIFNADEQSFGAHRVVLQGTASVDGIHVADTAT